MHLTVIHPFTRQDEAYQRGDKIFDQDVIKEVLEGENHRNVVRTFDGVNGHAPQQADLSKLN
jgi:hypothetical protein